jgi:DNA-binding winged helix-turn-helix (wHTH) protein/tetratricopeptide (TPR) repeat protein
MPPTGCYRFGDFMLCPSTRELCRDGVRLPLPAKSFDCVVYLALHRERAVGRDELASAVWGRVDVTESVLNQTVLHARRALGDAGRAQHVIRTVIGFGYHWVAPTDVVGTMPAAGDADREPRVEDDASTRRSRRPTLFRIAAAIAACIALALAVWIAPKPADRTSATTKPHRTIVVLPVEGDMSADTAWLRLGMMDLIASRLRDSGATVVPSDSVVSLARAFDAHDPADASRLADAVGARVVLQPRATKTADGWQIELAPAAGEAIRVARGVAAEPLDAGVAAAETAAAALGLAGRERETAGTESARRVLLQRIRAATLADRLDEARRLADEAPPDLEGDPELAFRRAKIDAQAGRTNDAEAALRALLAKVGAEKDAELRARIFDALGVLALQRGDAAGAEAMHDEAIALLRNTGDRGQLGKAFGNRAAARFAQHRDADATRDFAEARGALEEAGDRLSLTFLDANLGALDMLRDRYREAAPVFERAATRLDALRIPYAALNDWDAAAQSWLLLLEPAAALRIEPRLRELSAEVADPKLRLGAALTSVEILAANGARERAREQLAALHEKIGKIADTRALAGRAAAIAARFALADSDYREARVSAASAFDALAEPDDARERVRNWITLVRAAIGEHDIEGAAAIEKRIRVLDEADSTHASHVYATLASAELARARGDAGTARSLFEAALADANEGRVPVDVVESASAYADWLVTIDDLATASAVVEHVAPWASQSYEASLLQLRLYHAAALASAWATALDRTKSLAGERRIPEGLATPPR